MTISFNILNQVKVSREVQHIIKYQSFGNVILKISSGFLAACQFNSVPQLCLSLCDLMESSSPGFPVHHQFDAIQPFHPLSSPSPPTFNLSQLQGLFQRVSSSPKKLKLQYFGLLRSLYAGQEATVRTGHGTTDWLQIRKEVGQGSMQSPCKSSVYLRLLIFLPAILIHACAPSSLAFHMMYSAYKLNKQGDKIEP